MRGSSSALTFARLCTLTRPRLPAAALVAGSSRIAADRGAGPAAQTTSVSTLGGNMIRCRLTNETTDPLRHPVEV